MIVQANGWQGVKYDCSYLGINARHYHTHFNSFFFAGRSGSFD
jgi:hypothetical protein